VPYLVVVFVQIKRRLQGKLLALDFVQIGNTFVAHLELHCFLFFALFLCTLYFFLAHHIWYHFEASLIVKLHTLGIKI